MSKSPDYCTPEDSIQEVAEKMRDFNTGIIPIGEDDRLQGMITDRDIVVRGLAEGRGPDARVADVMTDKVLYCFAGDDVQDVLKNMQEQRVHRLIVLDDQEHKRLAGMISLSDIARAASNDNEMTQSVCECVQRDAEQTAYCA